MSTPRNRRPGIPIPAPLAAAILGCFALVFLTTAARTLAHQWDYRTHSTSASGTVTKAEYARGLGIDITVVLDGDTSGHTVSILDPNGAPSSLRQGQHVTVRYSSAHPTRAIFPSQLSWSRPAFLGGIGLVALALACSRTVTSVCAFRRPKDRRNAPATEPPFEGWGAAKQAAFPDTYVDRSNEPLFPGRRRR